MAPFKAVLLFDGGAFQDSTLRQEDSLDKIVSCLRVVCLRLLTEFANRCQDEEEFLFGYKFFDSRGSLAQEMEKHKFRDLNLESFSSLELKLRHFYGGSISCCQTTPTETDSVIKIINKLFVETLCDFDWSSSDACSPVRNLSKRELYNQNFAFLFSRCPVTSEDDDDGRLQSCSLMSPALHKKFIVDSHINLVWVDTAQSLYIDKSVSQEDVKAYKAFLSAITNLNGFSISLRHLVQACNITGINNSLLHCSSTQCPSQSIDNGELNHCKIEDFFTVLFDVCSRRNFDAKTSTCSVSFSSGEKLVLTLATAGTVISKNGSLMSSKQHIKSSSHGSEENKNLKFLVDSVVPIKFYGVPLSTYLVTVSDNSLSKEDVLLFAKVIDALSIQKKCLVLKQDDNNGDTSSRAIFYPLNISSAVVAAHDSLADLLKEESSVAPLTLDAILNVEDVKNGDVSKDCFPTLLSSNLQNDLMSSQELAAHILSQRNSAIPDSKAQDEPSSELLLDSPRQEYGCMESFLKKLQHRLSNEKRKNSLENMSPRRSPRLSCKRNLTSPGCSRISKLRKGSSSKRSPCAPSSMSFSAQRNLPTTLSESECQDEEKVAECLRVSYNACLESQKDVFKVAQTILGDTMLFLKTKSFPVQRAQVEEYLSNHHISLTMKEIQDKYNGKDDLSAVSSKIREYQLQVIFNLEVEAEFPGSSPSKCIRNVTAFLRGMSFVAGPGELLKFLQEHVKEQYSHCLQHVLVEIGEELNVPIIPESFCPSSPSEVGSPGGISRSSASPCSSVIVCRSSSSQLDEATKRKSFVRHSSFSGNFHNRQIMVPKGLVRKEKPQKMPKTDIRLLRRSPRLSMRQMTKELMSQKKHSTNSPGTKSVRRNLFNVEKDTNKSPQKKSTISEPTAKRRLFRSKSQQSTKKTIVPETPSPKQGKSALRRRQARVHQQLGKRNTVQEIAESPLTSKSETLRIHQNGSNSRKYAHIEKKYKT